MRRIRHSALIFILNAIIAHIHCGSHAVPTSDSQEVAVLSKAPNAPSANTSLVKRVDLKNTASRRSLAAYIITRTALLKNINVNTVELREKTLFFRYPAYSISASLSDQHKLAKDLYIALYEKLYSLAADNTKKLIQPYIPSISRNPEINNPNQQIAKKDVVWFCTNVQKLDNQPSLRYGTRSIITMMLIVGEFAKIDKRHQKTLIGILTPVDVSRFLAIALICRIPEGFCHSFVPVISALQYTPCQIILSAVLFIQTLDDETLREIPPQIEHFLLECLSKVRTNSKLPQGLWWCIHVIQYTLKRLSGPEMVNPTIRLDAEGATLSSYTSRRNDWPMLLWDEQCLNEIRAFTAKICDSYQEYANGTEQTEISPVSHLFFEKCVPKDGCIGLAEQLLDCLYLRGADAKQRSLENPLFAWVAVVSLSKLFFTWISDRFLSVAEVNALLSLVKDSEGSYIIPILLAAYKATYPVFIPHDKSKLKLFWLNSKKYSGEATPNYVILYPITYSADAWLENIVSTDPNTYVAGHQAQCLPQ